MCRDRYSSNVCLCSESNTAEEPIHSDTHFVILQDASDWKSRMLSPQLLAFGIRGWQVMSPWVFVRNIDGHVKEIKSSVGNLPLDARLKRRDMKQY